jgi:hypothetical protein
MLLRNPKFGNSFSLDTRVRIHKLEGDDIQIFKPSDQPAIHSFKVDFEALTDLDIQNFLNFLDASAGELITLKDHEGTDWEGVITSPTVEIMEYRENGSAVCQWQTGFEFEGKRV